ncbi:HD domain-containing protein [Micromonospora sp. L31]|uniref:HD domain-containing protein n=1 Tax=Micromonospora sp. L31 TaxID=3452213 RepID=UPI003F88F132
MGIVRAAYLLAEAQLADSIPRRWVHVQAVAAKAASLRMALPVDERACLVAAAWLHDVGYAPALVSTGLHALDGARWLRAQGFDNRVTDLVAHHSCAVFEAEERGYASQLRAEFVDEESLVRDALWYADMTTGPDGQDMTVSERLAEVRNRYGPEHVVTIFWAKAEPALLAAVRRTEEHLAAVDIQPM